MNMGLFVYETLDIGRALAFELTGERPARLVEHIGHVEVIRRVRHTPQRFPRLVDRALTGHFLPVLQFAERHGIDVRQRDGTFNLVIQEGREYTTPIGVKLALDTVGRKHLHDLAKEGGTALGKIRGRERSVLCPHPHLHRSK
jgi:hypothetical protein